ncbi:hypothetical protein [Nitrosospira sp. NRS527]|uniref:hypothetical protein n=1 Tax=Nitrosospira sp. NRS527 TaxID=155925 RepID=UPI001AFAEAAD|nr:hypothetical protein [Nitrosospira sp. NRS527]BCT68731.1 hypothetical protein NNRS527_02335 [Nitrosospira sp. NRS527]
MSTTTSSFLLISEPSTYSAIAAMFSAIAAFFSYRINKKSLSSKFNDRFYDINKLIVSNPNVYEAFLKQADRSKADYFETTPVDTLHVQLKSLVYFYLNLFEEMLHVHETKLPFMNGTWKAWQHYIFKRLKHPLIKEVVLAECNLRINEQGKLEKFGAGASIFNDSLILFLVTNYEKWSGPADKRVW